MDGFNKFDMRNPIDTDAKRWLPYSCGIRFATDARQWSKHFCRCIYTAVVFARGIHG